MIALAAAAALWAIPPHALVTDVLLMRAWYAQNDVCRGSPSVTPACRWRNDTQRILVARGWAWTGRNWRRI